MRTRVRRELAAGVLMGVLVVVAFGISTAYAEALGPSWSQTGGINYEVLSCTTDLDLNYIYCVAGVNANGYTNTVGYAAVSSNGSIGAWSATTAYPLSVIGHSCVSYQFYIYCVAGFDGGARLSSVYYAQVSTTGLGSWQTTTPYPFGDELLSCVSSSGFVYCVGGFDGIRYLNTTYYGKLSSSGGITAWTTTATYPTKIASHSCVTSQGYIYCVGGMSNSTTLTDATYYAPLSASGGIGGWGKTASYPVKAYGLSCVAQSGYIYCVGGLTNAGYTNAVYYAPLSSTGIGSWTATTAYPSNVYAGSCVTLSSRIYCLGGFDGSSTIFYGYSNSPSQKPVTQTSTTTFTSTSTTTTTFTPAVTSTLTSVSTVTTTPPAQTVTTTSTSFLTTLKTSVLTVTFQSQPTVTSTLTTTLTGITTVTESAQTRQSTQTQGTSAGYPPEIVPAVAGLVSGILLTFLLTRVMRRGESQGASGNEKAEERQEDSENEDE